MKLGVNNKMKDDGFTLIELLVVMVIMSILGSIGLFVGNHHVVKARSTAVLSDVTNWVKQVDLETKEFSGDKPDNWGGTNKVNTIAIVSESKKAMCINGSWENDDPNTYHSAVLFIKNSIVSYKINKDKHCSQDWMDIDTDEPTPVVTQTSTPTSTSTSGSISGPGSIISTPITTTTTTPGTTTTTTPTTTSTTPSSTTTTSPISEEEPTTTETPTPTTTETTNPTPTETTTTPPSTETPTPTETTQSPTPTDTHTYHDFNDLFLACSYLTNNGCIAWIDMWSWEEYWVPSNATPSGVLLLDVSTIPEEELAWTGGWEGPLN